MKHFLIFVCLILSCLNALSQECLGVSIRTHEQYLYGRFEVRMRSAEGNGVVSSFFTYNVGPNCTWPEANNEIDIEMTGNTDDVLFTTHYPSLNYYTDTYDAPFNPHESLNDYAFEWEPGIVRWFANGELVNIQNASYVQGLIYPQSIMMNLWASEVPAWVGVWDPSIMPVSSEYDYVRYYELTPGEGNAGTGNNFTLLWEDEFDSLDESRWQVDENDGFDGNYCSFRPYGLEFEDGKMIFNLEENVLSDLTVPVSFSVDASALDLNPGDGIYLNGTFNNWCGTCAPMSLTDGIWSVTIDLPEGVHEYLYTKNLWQEVGGAPLGSECDFRPCDEYANYGFFLNLADGPLVLDTFCWGSCESCAVTSVEEQYNKGNKTLLRVIDTLGREVNENSSGLLIYHYTDGSVEKRWVLSTNLR